MGAHRKLIIGMVLAAVFIAGALWYNKALETSLVFEKIEEKPVIVIDAGHGGQDGGAEGADGTLEKDLNLSIAQRLKAELSQYDVNVIMTREDDRGLYDENCESVKERHRQDLSRRKGIIEGAGADLVISIHINSFLQDDKVCGPQVFYPLRSKGEQTERTDEQRCSHTVEMYAQEIEKAFEINGCNGAGRKPKAKGDIYLFKNTGATIILVECGFISCPQELALLKTAKYQQLLARSICDGIDEILYLKEKEKIEVIDSKNK